MISYNTDYFGNNCYFYLRDGGDKISLYYSVGGTLKESRKNEERQDFKKIDSEKLSSFINKVLKGKKKYSKEQLKKMPKPKKSEENQELDELVGDDGGFLSKSTPILNDRQHTDATLDQTTLTGTQPGNPVTRGQRAYWGSVNENKDGVVRGQRTYYGEGAKNKDNVVFEDDMSKMFGREETEYLDYEDTVETFKKMGVPNPDERAEESGKIPNQRVRKDKKGDPVLKQRLVEKGTIDEEQKRKMIKMVEDILTKKSKDKSDVVTKENPISKILVKNLNSIKKIADKEGISINQLIKILKTNE